MNAGPATPDDVQKNESEDREERELLDALKRATIGEYDIYSRLGRGGMATVFLALELSLNRAVAIKVISPSALSSTTIIDRFWLEARTAASLSHPHVIPIYAVRAVGGLHFFVMKHIQGGSLDVVLRNEGPFSFALTRTILSQVGSALAYAHRRGVIHRDIKPANIMLDDEGYAVVMDFGIAKVRDAAALTASGAMVGTPYYMSPEQFSGERVDGKSDQYSLGVVAFELLTGHRPYKGETVAEALRGHLIDKAPDVREFRPECPTALATALNRMLCKEPDDRYPSMESLCAHLDSMPRINSDKIREQIISLARTASSSNPQISEPVSPLPPARSWPEIGKAPPLPEYKTQIAAKPVAGKKRPLVLGAVAVATLIIAAVATLPSWGSTASKNSPSGTTINQNHLQNSPAALLNGKPANGVRSENPDSAANPKYASASNGNGDSTGNHAVGAATNVPAADAAKAKETSRSKSPPRNESRTKKKVPSTVPSEDTAAKSPPLPIGILPFAPQPVEPPPAPPTAFRIGSRSDAAFLYIDGLPRGIVSALKAYAHPPGRVHLQIKAEDCMTWDTTFTLSAGDSTTIGYRNPRCTK